MDRTGDRIMSEPGPTIWSRLRGHEDQVRHFGSVLAAGRLGHAHLLVGPDGVGKLTFARMLATCLLCPRTPASELDACGNCPSCKQMAAGSHPDLLEVGLPEGKNIIPISALVGDRDSRGRAGLCYDLSLSPMESTRRVAILDAADHLAQDGYSALLKTLEEPPADSIMILVAGSESDIRDTIRSRCQLVRFGPLATNDVTELLLLSGETADRQEALEAAELSDGSIATALAMLNPDMRTLRDTLFECLSQFPLDTRTLTEEVVASWETLGTDSHSKRINATWIARFAIEFYRSVLRILAEIDTDSPMAQVNRACATLKTGDRETMDLVGLMLDRCAEAERDPMGNVMLPLALEAFFSDLGRLSRRPVA